MEIPTGGRSVDAADRTEPWDIAAAAFGIRNPCR